jgi:small subunit ribosomal protein S26e
LSSGITRKKGQSGRAKVVQCIQCGQLVPRDKAIRKRKASIRLDYKLRVLLKKRGAYISNRSSTVYYCVSCAKHRKYV